MKIFCTALLTALALPCGAAPVEHHIECPPEIPLETISITSAPTGWTPFFPFEYRNGMPLTSAGLMWGPPDSMTMAKPTSIGKVRGKNVERWDELGMGGEKWMACYYGKDGYPDAIMSKRIADSAIACTVTYPKDGNDRRLEIACTW